MRSLSKKSDGGSLNGGLKFLLCLLPLALFFSYHPVISLGTNESMNFELSVPLIWLMGFDIVAMIMMWRRKISWAGLKWGWLWLLFPLWLGLSVIWSLNAVRGVLTVGILGLVYLAGYAVWSLRDLWDEEFRKTWGKWFFGATMMVCGWCVVQCVLDLVGVPRDYSLMCAGCTYHMFGFPHPNGFAIEPQFMGNLLLAPTMVAAFYVLKTDKRQKLFSLILFGVVATLFLTFSRGAIYAMAVGLMFLSGYWIAKDKQKWQRALKRVGIIWGIVGLGFLFTLNLQGVMAEVGPTSDTYNDGVAKVVNHLSLGVIDTRVKNGEAGEEQRGNGGKPVENSADEVVENSVDNNEEKAAFDGYVVESTDTRLRLTGAAVEVWKKDVWTMLFGVGLGGAGQALYDNGLSPAPKEIVQNEYASLLLETGLVGIILFVLTLALAVRGLAKNRNSIMVLSLMVAYGVSLLFFSGLANALQIYLMSIVLGVVYCVAVRLSSKKL